MYKFIYKIINKIPGLLPGEYNCEFIGLKVKTTKKGLQSILTLRIMKERKDNVKN